MKKTLLITLLCALTSFAFAIGNNKGNTRANATDFDWTQAYERNSANPWWFEIDITDVKQMQNPTLALYITNLSTTQTATVTASLFLGSSNTSMQDQTFDLAPGQYKIMSANVNAIKNFTYSNVQLCMSVSGTTDMVALSAKALETKRADVACKTNTTVTVGGPQVAGAAGTTWYNFDIHNYTDDTKQLRVTITPSAATTIKTSLSYDCPCTGSTDETEAVAAGAAKEILISGTVLQALNEFRAYLSVNSSVSYQIKVEEESAIVIPPVTPITPTEYDFVGHSDGYDLVAGDNWFVFEYDSIIDDLLIPNVVLTASAGADVTVDMGYKNASEEIAFLTSTPYDWSFAGAKSAFPLDVNILTGSKAAFKDGSHYYVYYRINTTASDLHFKMLVNAISSGSEDCEAYVEITDWTESSTALTLDWDPTTPAEYEDFQGWLDLSKFKDFILNGHHVDIQVKITEESGSANTMKVAQVNCGSALTDNSYSTRTLAGDEVKTRLIKYSQYSAYGDTLLFRIKATGDYWLQFTAVEAAEADPATASACETNTPFDWRYGHNIAADADEWFEVDLDTVHNTDNIPVLTIRNDGDAKANVKIQYAYECPITYELPDPASHNVTAGNSYTEKLTRESLLGIANKKMYVRIQSNKDVYFSIAFERDNDYANRICDAALDFNWTGGHIQEDTTLWYAIDLAKPKAERKIIVLHMKNLSDKKVNVRADLATMCPYNNLQGRSTTIKPDSTYTAPEISYGMYDGVDTVWVRLKTDKKVRFWAELKADPMSLDTIKVCDPALGAQLLTWDAPIVLTQDTVWFWFPTDSFKSTTWSDLSYVPQIKVVNPTSSPITATAEVAFHCPITYSMLKRNQTVKANDSIVSKMERDMLDGYLNKYDTVFVRVVGKGLAITATMIDPNLGSDCSHAIAFQYGTDAAHKAGHLQAAGEDMWYKLDVSVVSGRKLMAGIANLVDATNKADVGIYITCDGDPVQKGSRTLAALANPERDLGELMSGLAVQYIYLNVKATDSVHVYGYFDGDLPTGPEVNFCDRCMKSIKPNVHYQQGKRYDGVVDTVLYYVDVANLDTTTIGDATITITPLTTTPVNVKADLYWSCHTTDFPTTKGLTISAPYTKTLTREAIKAIAKDSAFIWVYASDSIDFVVNVTTINSCMNPVEFKIVSDYCNCDAHPANEWVWYHIAMDSLISNPDKDLRLLFTNQEDSMVTVKVDSIVLTCGEVPMMSIGNKTLAAHEVKTQDVDNSLLQDFNITNTGISMKVWSDGQISICPTLIPAIEGRRDTFYVDTLICHGSDFVDPRFSFAPDSIDVHNHTITALDHDTTMIDSIGFRYDGTFHGDSILIYKVTVSRDVVFPAVIDSSYLSSLVLEPGKGVTDAVRAAIFTELLDSIKAQPYTSWIDSTEAITWSHVVWSDVEQAYVDTTALSDSLQNPFLEELTMVVSYTDTCGWEQSATLRLSFDAAQRCETPFTYNDTVCTGYHYINTLHGIDSVITANASFLDTCVYVNAAGDQKCDSIVTFNFVVRTAVYNRPDASQYPTMQAGDTLACADATAAVKANWYDDNDVAADSIASIAWTYCVYNIQPGSSYADASVPSVTDVTKAKVALKITTNCGKEIFDTLDITLAAADTIEHIINEHKCYGDSLQGWNNDGTAGAWHYALQDTVRWTDTIYNEVKAGSIKKYNGIYNFTLTTIVPKDTTTNEVICEGDTLFWHGRPYTTNVTALDSTIYSLRYPTCDSVHATLNLRVAPHYLTDTTVTICGTETFTWEAGTKSGKYAGIQYTGMDATRLAPYKTHVLRDTVQTEDGCDSIFVLNISVGQVYEDANTYRQKTCQGGGAFTWPTNSRIIFADDSVAKAGVYHIADTLSGAFGCDSIDHYYLTVKAPVSTQLYDTICYGAEYTWSSNTKKYTTSDYLAAGLFRDSVLKETLELGCDSMVYLNLTVNPTYLIEETYSICDNGTYQWQGRTLTAANAGENRAEYKTKGCDCDSVYVLTLVVNPTYQVNDEDTICLGQSVDLGLDPAATPTKRGEVTYTRRLQTRVHGCDSIVTLKVWVRTLFTLPGEDVLDTVPQLVCGETPMLDNINAAIAEWLEANVTRENEQVNLAVNPILWQVLDPATRTWVDLDLTKPAENNGEETLRYVITTECGNQIVGPSFTIPVETPSTDNIYSVVHIPAFAKYNDWLMMIDVNSVNATLAKMGLPSLTPKMVQWFKINGTIDPIGAKGLPDGDDGHMTPNGEGHSPDTVGGYAAGYYYAALDMAFAGQYYAVIVIPDTILHDGCGLSLRTNTIVCGSGTTSGSTSGSTSGNAPEADDNNGSVVSTNPDNTVVGNKGQRPDFKAPIISPTIVNAGSPIYVYNLNPEIETTIEIFDLMGERIDAVKVSGVDTYTYSTPAVLTGYFLMNISSEEDVRALKYIAR